MNLLSALIFIGFTGSNPTPYFDAPVTIPGTLQMHWFDKGGEGVAYHDCNEQGSNEIRKGEAVDFARDGGDVYLGWLCPGEWIRYSLSSADHATYRIEVRLASETGGRFSLDFEGPDGKSRGKVQFKAPQTAGWTRWQTVSGDITLPAGPLGMRFDHLSGHDTYNIDRIIFSRFDPFDFDRDGKVSTRDKQAADRLRKSASRSADIKKLDWPAADTADLEAALNGWRPLDGSALPKDAPWKLTWADEFDKPGKPDPARWQYEVGFKIRNNEAQYYTEGKNAFVADGNLVIEARREPIKTPTGRKAFYTSASMSPTVPMKYGRIEVRAKVPTGNGMWPAIWMLADRFDKVGWPKCGEIDIMENVGHDPKTLHGSVHTKKYNHTLGTQATSSLDRPQPWKDFHVYAIEWTPNRIDFYVDRVKYLTFANEGSGEDAWPFDHPHRLKLNIAVGGMWGAVKGIDDSNLPQRMLVDYVRAYQPSK